MIEDYWTNQWKDAEIDRIDPPSVAKPEIRGKIEKYVARLPDGAGLLDGGCGLGQWARYYASRGFAVTALDISRETIGRLAARFPDVAFVHADIRETGLPDESFDAYYSWGTFEHFENGLGDCFAEARRVLKTNGYPFITVPYQNRRHLRRDLRALEDWDENYDARSGYGERMRFYQWRLTKPELHREFAMHGFCPIEIVPVDKSFGVRRALRHDWHLADGNFLHRAMARILVRIGRANYFAHMLLGVGVKISREESDARQQTLHDDSKG